MQTNPSVHPTIDVLIVGAGPTGLMAALELARRNIQFRLVEKLERRSPYSKAMALHARTLETVELLSEQLADTFVRTGYTSPGANLGAGNSVAFADFSQLDTNYPYMMFVPQSQTETLLEQQLTETGRRVEFGVDLKSLTQKEDGVDVQLQHQDGHVEEISARYVLGCDGAHSTVRHMLGLSFEGRGYPWVAMLGDVKSDSSEGKNGLTQYSSERGLALLIPFQDDYTRIVTIDTAHQHEAVGSELTLQELQESVSAIVPAPIRLSEPRWLTRWSAQLRQASRYRMGRVFIAGDAAHIHSPAGGQGLNTGVQDAYNIAWKVALVLQGQAPESLLDTYEAERYPVGQQILRESDALIQSTLVPNALTRAGRNIVLKALTPIPFVQHAISTNLSGLAISYHHENQGAQLTRLITGPRGLQAGDRVPDVELKHAVLTPEIHTAVSLYSLLREAPYSLFIYLSPSQFEQDRSKVERILERINAFGNETIRSYVVFEQGTNAITHDFDVTTFFDYKYQFHHKVGARHGSMVLIRPDSYIALHSAKLQQEQLLTGLRQWLVAPQVVAR